MQEISGIFHAAASPQWTDIGNFAAQSASVLGTIIIGCLQLRKPQPRLLYSIHKPPRKQLGKLTASGILLMRSSAGPVSDPHLINIALDCRVAGGIDKKQFNDDKPIRFDVGIPILSHGQTSRPEEQPCPQSSLKGNVLEVGPDYFLDPQLVTFTLVVEGPPQSRTRATSPFHVLRLKRTYWAGSFVRLGILTVSPSLVMAAPPACGIIAGILAGQQLSVAAELLLLVVVVWLALSI